MSINSMSPGEIILALEALEIEQEKRDKMKSVHYRTAEALEYSLEAIRQVLHYRRVSRKYKVEIRGQPSQTFMEYMAQAAGKSPDPGRGGSMRGRTVWPPQPDPEPEPEGDIPFLAETFGLKPTSMEAAAIKRGWLHD